MSWRSKQNHRLVNHPLSLRLNSNSNSKSKSKVRDIARLRQLSLLCFAASLLLQIGVSASFQNQPPDMRGAWKSHGTNQRELVDQLRTKGIIRTDAVATVMGLVDRGNYCFLRPRFAAEADHLCYADRALAIGMGQTISAPHMHAFALEAIHPSVEKSLSRAGRARAAADGDDRSVRANSATTKILDVGCGSGYLTACFGRWLSPTRATSTSGGSYGGRVFGIDVRRDLVDMTRKNLARKDGDLLASGLVDLSLRDGWKGLPEEAPFDAIHVGAAAATLPKRLANQLKVGGVLIVPIGLQDSNQHQVLYKIKRVRGRSTGGGDRVEDASADDDRKYYSSEDSFREDDYEIRSLLGVRYVPLVRGEDLA